MKYRLLIVESVNCRSTVYFVMREIIWVRTCRWDREWNGDGAYVQTNDSVRPWNPPGFTGNGKNKHPRTLYQVNQSPHCARLKSRLRTKDDSAEVNGLHQQLRESLNLML